ncbi:MAG: DUF5947 family protein, partial [Gemmatimonadales bacterium]
PPPPAPEHCDFCGGEIAPEHRHVLDLEERRILCTCEPCLIRQEGLARYRPTGRRLVALDGLELSEDLWSRFQIPVGLAFFLRSSAAGRLVALYPSPAGATESELDLAAWEELRRSEPLLDELEPDTEALLVSRTVAPPAYFIAPIDECYRLVGLIKSRWRGISGGTEAEAAISGFLTGLRERALTAAGGRAP